MDNRRKLSEYRSRINEMVLDKRHDLVKERFRKEVHTRIRTSFIFSLSEIERMFGELWGQGLDYSELTEEEIEFRRLFLEMRKAILDNGNAQIRAFDYELDGYKIEACNNSVVFTNIGKD